MIGNFDTVEFADLSGAERMLVLLASAFVLRGVVFIVFTGVIAYLWFTASPLPEDLSPIYGVILGTFFQTDFRVGRIGGNTNDRRN